MSGEQGTGPGGSPRRMRVAEVFDGRGPAGEIVVDRPPVDPAEFAALTGYLTKAPVALATTKTGEDEMSPGAGLAVPRAYHTDGEWIWPAAVGYYLHRYQLPPQPELLEHIRARGFRVGAVAEELRQAAAAQMLEELAAAKRAAAAAGPGAPAVPAGPVPATVSAARQDADSAAPPPRPVPAAAPVPPPPLKPEPEPEPSLWMPAPAEESAETGEPGEPRETASPAGEVLAVTAFSPAFTAAGNRHAAWVYEQIETFLDFMPVDEWSVDHATRRYRQAGREFHVDALGRLAPDGRWIWAWAEPESWSPDPALTERSRLLRDEGGRLGIRELTSPVLDLSGTADADDPETAAEMLAWTAMGVAGARGYIGHSLADDGRIYYLALDESIPVAVPDIEGVSHFLSHGSAKFEEDATDCVLGYVDHYGWDWSRAPEGGITVSAGPLGSFTAQLSADGLLTGISPHD